MDKRRANGWATVGLFVGIFVVIGPGCAAGNVPSFGEGGDDGTWNGGASTSSGMGGMGGTSSSSTSSSSSGSPCSGPEICNGKDDDCNGTIDDNVEAVGNPCNTGLVGVCGVGAVDCQNGSPLCVTTNESTPEVCDNLDNDCNGQVDDGNPGGGDTCTTAMPGPCALGVITCMAGAFVCAPVNQAVAEVCGDSVDNDCNGTVDNGCGMGGSCSHDPCVPGAALASNCAPCVTIICNMDDFCCSTLWDATCSSKALDICPGC